MAILIFILFLLTLYHFLWENIVVPSMRLNLKYKYYSLRDWLRNLKMEHKDAISDEAFQLLDDSINSKINVMEEYDIFVFMRMKWTVEKSPEMLGFLKEKSEHIEKCEIKEIKTIYLLTGEYILKAMAINMSAAWIYFIIPAIPIAIVALLVYVILSGFSKIKNHCTMVYRNYRDYFSLIQEENSFPQYFHSHSKFAT